VVSVIALFYLLVLLVHIQETLLHLEAVAVVLVVAHLIQPLVLLEVLVEVVVVVGLL